MIILIWTRTKKKDLDRNRRENAIFHQSQENLKLKINRHYIVQNHPGVNLYLLVNDQIHQNTLKSDDVQNLREDVRSRREDARNPREDARNLREDARNLQGGVQNRLGDVLDHQKDVREPPNEREGDDLDPEVDLVVLVRKRGW